MEPFLSQYAGVVSRTPEGVQLPLRRFPFVFIPVVYTQWEDPEMGPDVAAAARRFLGLAVPQAELVNLRVSVCLIISVSLPNVHFCSDASCDWTVV